MQSNSHAGVKFTIGPSATGWCWSTFDTSGALLSSGETRSRREAAAVVIREIVRAALPAALLDQRQAA